MGIAADLKKDYEAKKEAAKTELEKERAELIPQLEHIQARLQEIDADLAELNGEPQPAKRGRPVGSKSKAKEE